MSGTFYDQVDDIDHHTLGITDTMLEDIVDYIATDGVEVVTVSEGVGLME